MTSWHRAWLALALLLTALLAVTLAGAQKGEEDEIGDAERGAVRTLGYEGVKHYEAGEYPQAAEKLDRAYRVLKVPTLGLWSARALVKLGRLVEASERYLEVTRVATPELEGQVHEQAKQDAANERAAIIDKIAALTVTVEAADAADVELVVDGRPIPRALWAAPLPLDPGRRVVEGRRGEQLVSREVVLAEGEKRELTLSFGPSPEPQPPTPPPVPAPEVAPPVKKALRPDDASRDSGAEPAPGMGIQEIAGWTAVAVGGAALVTGVVLGGVALAKHRALDCPDNACAPEQQDDVDQVNAMRVPSTVLMIVGAVSVGGGVALVLTAPDRKVAFGLGPAGLVLTGAF